MLMPEGCRPPRLAPRSDEITNELCRAVELMPHGALVFNENGTVVAANRRSGAIFGYAPHELLKQPVQRFLSESSRLSPADLGRGVALNRRSMDAGIRKDGAPVPLEVGFSVVNEGSSRFVVASVVDISERVDLETGLMTAQEEFLNFERLVGDLITDLAGMNPEKLDPAIVNGLGRIAEALRLDAGIVWRKAPGKTNFVATHHWVRPPAPHPADAISAGSLPWAVSQLQAGKAISFARLSDVSHERDREALRQLGLTSAVMLPLPAVANDHQGLSALVFGSLAAEREWSPVVVDRLHLAAALIGQALGRSDVEVALRKALREVRQLSAGLGDEHDRLRRDAKPLSSQSIVLDSAAIKRAFSQAESVAPMPATVLLLGETGCGKEVFAQAIHDLSPRRHRPMVKLNCAAIPATLIESEMFGRERGAFTGALSRQIGRFEAANLSTLFLDEIGELPLEVQVKLLRAIQERVIERLGSNQAVKVDVRIIAATNRNLEKAVEDQTFREDLYYRLNVFPIVVPPLRERVEDIPGLVWSFVDDFSKMFAKPIDTMSKASMQELMQYTWPGNVRELRNVIERAMIVCASRHLQVSVPKPAAAKLESSTILADLESTHIRTVLESTNWRVRGAGGAAERLGLKPTTLESRMAKLGIRRTIARKPTPSDCEAEIVSPV